MNISPNLIAVHVECPITTSKSEPELVLSSGERTKLGSEFQEYFTVHWLPHVTKPRIRHHLFNDSTIYIYLLGGFVFGSVVKPFFEAFAQEAGKEFWTALKTFIAKLWKSQADKTYKLQTNIYIIFELKDDFVAIPLKLVKHGDKEDQTLQQCIDGISAKLTDIELSWRQVVADIDKFHLGERPTHQIHVIERHEDKGWMITGEESWEFFKHRHGASDEPESF